MGNKCSSSTKNTGSSRCKFDWGLFKRCIVTPTTARFTGVDAQGQPQDFDDWLDENIHAATAGERFYPMPAFTNNETNTTDRLTWTNAYGQEFTIRPGNKGWTQSYQPDYCLSNRLSSFNDGIERRVIILDANGKAWGCEDAEGHFMGFTVQIFHTSPDIVPADSLPEGKVSYTAMKPGEFDHKMPYDYEIDVDNYDGLTDVNMVAVKGTSTTEISFYDECGTTDLTAEMASMDDTCWLDNGSQMSTAPTYNETKRVFSIENNALTSGHKITVANPSVLYAAGVLKKECKTTYVVS